VEKYGTARKATDDYIIRRMRFPCFITEDTNTHSEYVISIAFPRQQWLQECTSLLRYTRTYIACLAYVTWKISGGERLGIDKTVISELLCLLLRHFAENELSATTGMRVLVRLISNSNQPSGPLFVCFLC